MEGPLVADLHVVFRADGIPEVAQLILVHSGKQGNPITEARVAEQYED
jgi:hypothetical protein